MIRLKEQAIKDIGDLNSIEVAKIYELIRFLKDNKKRVAAPCTSYLKVREALLGFNGSLSDDILVGRDETL